MSQLLGEGVAELQTPLPHRLIADGDPAFGQQLFDLAKAQAKAVVQPHGVTDDFRGKAMVLIPMRGRGNHTPSTSHEAAD